MKNNIMVDNETLATTADAAILSIGAVKFDLETGVIDENPFYVSISLDSNTEQGRKISESTLIFWLNQSKEAQIVFHEPKISLREALEQFSDWVGETDYQVWSNGADFDIPMLAHAFTANEMNTPWKYNKARCYRTLRGLPNMPKATIKNPLAHHALSDAIYQAQHLIEIFRTIIPTTQSLKAVA